MGKGEAQEGGRDKDSILSDTVEALIATYLQHGLEPTRVIVERLIDQKVKEAAVLGPQLDWRAGFEELAHTHGFEGNASFEITGVGPDHSRVYTATISMGGRTWEPGRPPRRRWHAKPPRRHLTKCWPRANWSASRSRGFRCGLTSCRSGMSK